MQKEYLLSIPVTIFNKKCLFTQSKYKCIYLDTNTEFYKVGRKEF